LKAGGEEEVRETWTRSVHIGGGPGVRKGGWGGGGGGLRGTLDCKKALNRPRWNKKMVQATPKGAEGGVAGGTNRRKRSGNVRGGGCSGKRRFGQPRPGLLAERKGRRSWRWVDGRKGGGKTEGPILVVQSSGGTGLESRTGGENRRTDRSLIKKTTTKGKKKR